MRRRAVRLVVALGLAVAGFLLIPNRWFYKERRPTRFGRIVNRCWSGLASLGITPAVWPGTPRIGTITIETLGRRSSRTRANVVTWVEQDGDCYLVSMLGERSDWVRNARAAGGSAVIRHRGRRTVRLEEVPTGERAPILKAYLRRTAMSTRHHLGLDPEAPLDEFERIASSHPVFRIVGAQPSNGPVHELPIPYRWFYRNGRPTRAGKTINRLWARAFSTGILPDLLVSLEVRGRRSGRISPKPLVVALYEGERFLVSMLGDHVDWVRNVRAAGGEAYIRRGRRQNVRLEEVPVGERAPIIKAYLQRATGARPHIEIPHDAPVEAFEPIAARHPVFRIVELAR